jgi:ferric iron reductase protein FhuF
VTAVTAEDIYRVLDARMAHHAGSAVSPGLVAVPAEAMTDAAWVRSRIGRSARLYGCADADVLGTIWWYSVSSVLVAPAIEGLVLTGTALDPAASAVTLHMVADGRLAGARSARALGRDPARVGAALGATLSPAIATLAEVSGTRSPALHAIASDSIGNRFLWAGTASGDVHGAMELAQTLVAATGLRMPLPRFVRIGTAPVLRRASCCLIYRATGGDKCTSCPRQRPQERERRLRAAMG